MDCKFLNGNFRTVDQFDPDRGFLCDGAGRRLLLGSKRKRVIERNDLFAAGSIAADSFGEICLQPAGRSFAVNGADLNFRREDAQDRNKRRTASINDRPWSDLRVRRSTIG